MQYINDAQLIDFVGICSWSTAVCSAWLILLIKRMIFDGMFSSHLLYNAIHWLSFLFHKAALTYHQVSKNVFVSLHLHLWWSLQKTGAAGLWPGFHGHGDLFLVLYMCALKGNLQSIKCHISYRLLMKKPHKNEKLDVNWVRSPRDALYGKMCLHSCACHNSDLKIDLFLKRNFILSCIGY